MATAANNQVDGRTKKRPGQEEQAAIITRAAVDLFSKHGTKPVSIAQICTHADVSRPTFYRCFKDKDELIASMLQRCRILKRPETEYSSRSFALGSTSFPNQK